MQSVEIEQKCKQDLGSRLFINLNINCILACRTQFNDNPQEAHIESSWSSGCFVQLPSNEV